jgi:hypothetical protein
MEVQIVIQGDDEMEARADPLSVEITVTGTARAVAEFAKLSNPRAIVQVKPEHFPTNDEWMRTETFVLEDIKLPDITNSTELRATEMVPNVIEVRIESVDTRSFPVEAPPDPELLGGALARIIQPTPSATVRGTKDKLDALKGSIKTAINRDALNALVRGLDDDPTITDRIDLEIAPAQQGIFRFLQLVEPKRLSAKVEISNEKQREIVVPVHIFTSSGQGDIAPRRLRFSPDNEIDKPLDWKLGEAGELPTMRLRLTGSPRSIERVDPAVLVVFVQGDAMKADETVSRLPVLVSGLPVGVRLEADITLIVQTE